MDQLCAVAQVSKRTAYQHFPSKDDLVAEYLRRFDPDVMPEVFDRTDLTPRERLLAAFDLPASTPLCPYIGAAVELHDPQHPACVRARLQDRDRGTAHRHRPRGRRRPTPNSSANNSRCSSTAPRPAREYSTATSFPTAAAIAAVLIDNAIPASSDGARSTA